MSNEYFAKKEEKEKEARVQLTKKRAGKFLKWLAVIVIVVGGGFWLLRGLNKPVEAPGEFFEAQSREHIPPGASHPEYNSNPPTGGWHYDQPAQTGIYDKELPDEQLIHNLEHSHIWISYRPDNLAPDQIEQLVAIAKSYGSRFIMTPRVKNDSPIVVAAWQRLLKLDSVDEKRIRTFADSYRNIAGPERNIPDSGFKDFRSGR